MTRVNLGITLNDQVLNHVDRIAEVDDIPRSRVIEQILKERFGISSPLQLAGQGEE
jgi:metal-responsive CopG/Arc/MetJ family transcriptional regulator